MTSPTTSPILAVSMSAVEFPPTPTHAIRRPSTFLSLVPTSYPQRPSPPASIASPKLAAIDDAMAVTSPVTGSAPLPGVELGAVTGTGTAAGTGTATGTATAAASETGVEGGAPTMHRRSSSLASDESGSVNGRLRFLKLGPVHGVEGGGDWSEVGVGE